jgi:hypothetical protein
VGGPVRVGPKRCCAGRRAECPQEQSRQPTLLRTCACTAGKAIQLAVNSDNLLTTSAWRADMAMEWAGPPTPPTRATLTRQRHGVPFVSTTRSTMLSEGENGASSSERDAVRRAEPGGLEPMAYWATPPGGRPVKTHTAWALRFSTSTRTQHTRLRYSVTPVKARHFYSLLSGERHRRRGRGGVHGPDQHRQLPVSRELDRLIT